MNLQALIQLIWGLMELMNVFKCEASTMVDNFSPSNCWGGRMTIIHAFIRKDGNGKLYIYNHHVLYKDHQHALWKLEMLRILRNWKTKTGWLRGIAIPTFGHDNPSKYPNILRGILVIAVPMKRKQNCLVVSTPLKNMKVSWDYYSQYMKHHKIHVPNHQADN